MTLKELIDAYYKTAQFNALAQSTQISYIYRYDTSLKPLHNRDVRTLTRGDFLQLVDDKSPATFNMIIKTASALLSWGVQRDHLPANPLYRTKMQETGHHRRWTDEEIRTMKQNFSWTMKLAGMLGLYTGQRQSDILNATWLDYDGEAMSFVQKKTGKTVYVPCVDELRRFLDTTHNAVKHNGHIVTNWRGDRMTDNGFRRQWKKECNKYGLTNVTFHGLRKTFGSMLADADCNEHGIGAVMGLSSPAMRELYTRDKRRVDIARRAIKKLDAFLKESS